MRAETNGDLCSLPYRVETKEIGEHVKPLMVNRYGGVPLRMFKTSQPDVVGTYMVDPNSIAAAKAATVSDSRIACPYCHEPMWRWEISATLQRRVRDNADGTFECATLTDAALVGCFECDARFIVPKNRSEWPVSDDAVGQR